MDERFKRQYEKRRRSTSHIPSLTSKRKKKMLPIFNWLFPRLDSTYVYGYDYQFLRSIVIAKTDQCSEPFVSESVK